jgi:hypothetical protein
MSSASSANRSDDARDERAPGPNPLSRRASRLFVIASILFVIAATAGGSYYLASMTSQALNAPMDSTAVEAAPPADTTAAPPDTESKY